MVLVGSLRKRDHLEDLDLDVGKISKCILNKMWAVELTDLSQDKDKLNAFVKAVMNHQIL